MTPQLGTWVTRRLPETPILPILRPHHGRASNRNPQPLPHAGPDRHLPRFVVIGKLLEDIEAKINQVRLADPRQQHTALLMGIEAELQSVTRQLDAPGSDLGSIHNRLKTIAAQLNALRFSEPRKQPKKDAGNTLYQLLKLNPGATQEEIKSAYHTLIKQYHPDVHNDSQFEWVRTESERMSRRISEAYDVLGDEQRRARYDRELRKAEEGTRA